MGWWFTPPLGPNALAEVPAGHGTTPSVEPQKRSRKNSWPHSLQITPDLRITAPGGHPQIKVVELLAAHPAEHRSRRTHQASAEHQQGAGLRNCRDAAVEVNSGGDLVVLLNIELQGVSCASRIEAVEVNERRHDAVRRSRRA